VFTVFCAFLLTHPAWCAEMAVGSYDSDARLKEILRTASAMNPNIAAEMERVNQSRASVREAASKFGPTVTAGVGAQRNSDSSQSAIDGALSTGYRNVYSASLTFVQTLYAGGSIAANKKAADLALSATIAEGVRVYQNVLNSARVGYYDCQRALAQLQVATEALALSREHLRQTEALHKAGLVPIGDVLRVRVSVSQCELDCIEAEKDLDVNWVVLERVVGNALPMGEFLHPIPGDRTLELKPPSYTAPNNALDRALEQRQEMRSYEFYKSQALQLAKSAAGDRLPKLSISGQTSATGDKFWPHGNDTWYIQMDLQWTLFDSGEISSRVEFAEASAREFLHRLEDLSAQVRQEVMQAELNLRSALKQLSVAENQITTAEEDYRIALKRYDAQVGTNLDVLDARVALTDSRISYVNAVYDIAIAQSGLIYAMGDDLPPDDLLIPAQDNKKDK
jgi:outer membrane protein TolC